MDRKIALSQRAARTFALAMFALSFVLVGTAPAVINCPGTISANYTLSEDISQTSSGNCITVTASNVTVNLAGHSIVCNRSGAACDAAVVINNSLSNLLVKNGYILSGTQVWTKGVSNGQSSGVMNSLTVTDVTIDGAATGVDGPGTKVQNSVFLNISAYCTNSGTPMPDGGQLFQNYCDSDGLGFNVVGPSSAGQMASVTRNYVRAGSSYAGISAGAGYITIEQNVIDRGSPFISEGEHTTKSKNVCDDDSDCPPPDSDFTFNMNFNP